jgi:hypothetical protein
MINLSNWRSVRLWESHVERQLRQRHWLWLHGIFIGSMVLGVMGLTSYFQMQMSAGSLALRYLVTLGVGYLAYLLVLRLWAGALVGRSGGNFDIGIDLSTPGPGRSPDADAGGFDLPGLQSGNGGDFGGAGASGDFSGAADAGGPLGELASGAIEVAASADEGAVVVVPVVAVFLLGCAIIFGVGSLGMLYFGWEALLTVAVEIAFSYVSARTAIRVVREGWLSAAVRLTWKPLLGAVVCAVLLGAAIDYFMPAAHSLPQAIKLIRAL